MDKMSENFFDGQFDKLSADLQKSGRIKIISKEFSEKKSDQERVSYLLKLDALHEHISFPDVRDSKSSVVASKLRNDSNKVFQKKDYKGSLKLYTQSIASAPPYRDDSKTDGDADLSLAYANRSAALFHMCLWSDCLKDITNALEASYPPRLRQKLYFRKGQCLIKLNNFEEAIIAFDEGKKAVDDAEIDVKKKASLVQDFEKNIAMCKSEESNDIIANDCDPFKGILCDRMLPEFSEGGINKVFPSLAEFCDVAHSQGQGRYLVAKRDIYPGEIVMIEKPFASVLLPENNTNFCHHCYNHCYSLVACTRCTQALYCGTTCRTTAWDTYHQYECGLMGALYNSGVGKFGHLALRTILTMSKDKLVEYQTKSAQKDVQDSESPLLRGCDLTGRYSQTDYRTIHSLVTHSEDRATHDLFRRAVMAIFLLKTAQKSTYFQAKTTEDDDPEFASYVGGLILSHLQSFPCNAHEISEFELDLANLVESTPIELGAGIYSTLSLFNHSCDPGVNRNFYGDTCVVRAIKTIHQGEEIADNYGVVYAVQPKPQRQQKLKPQYYFDCQCQPCREDWPLYPCIEHMTPTWKCANCSATASESNGMIKCAQCAHEQSVNDRLAIVSLTQEKYETAFEELMTCNVDTALPGLLNYLRELSENLVLPWREYNNCQEAVKQCFSIMGNCHIVNS